MIDDKERFIIANCSCNIHGVTYIIDQRNCLYRIKSDYAELLANLSDCSDNRLNQYGMASLLEYGGNLICLPNCGHSIFIYNCSEKKLNKIILSEEIDLCIIGGTVYNDRLYALEARKEKCIYIIDLNSYEINKDYLEPKMKNIRTVRDDFLSVSVVGISNYLYIGVWYTNQIIKYDLDTGILNLEYKSDRECELQYIFIDGKNNLWLSRNDIYGIERLNREGKIDKKIQFDLIKDNRQHIIKILFSENEIFVFPNIGNEFYICRSDGKNEKVKLSINPYDDHADEKENFFKSATFKNEELDIWTIRGRFVFNINSNKYSFSKIDKNKQLSTVDILLEEEKMLKKNRNNIYLERNIPLEFFLRVVCK